MIKHIVLGILALIVPLGCFSDNRSVPPLEEADAVGVWKWKGSWGETTLIIRSGGAFEQKVQPSTQADPIYTHGRWSLRETEWGPLDLGPRGILTLSPFYVYVQYRGGGRCEVVKEWYNAAECSIVKGHDVVYISIDPDFHDDMLFHKLAATGHGLRLGPKEMVVPE